MQSPTEHAVKSGGRSTEAFWAEPPARDALLACGADAVRFIDGFQTAAVGKLGFGRGSAAFFTDGRGHVLALANIFRLPCVETGSHGQAGAERSRQGAAVAVFTCGDSPAVAVPACGDSPAVAVSACGDSPAVAVSACGDSPAVAVWIDLPRGAAAGLIEHLEHYHIREDVEFVDVSSASGTRGVSGTSSHGTRGVSGTSSPGTRGALLVGGAAAAAWLESAAGLRLSGPLPREPLELAKGWLGDVPVVIVRSDRWTGVPSAGCAAGGFEVHAAEADLPRLAAAFSAAGLPRIASETLEELRILGRHPEPWDIPPKTLPQELDRPAAISFTKGCYLGQETVARLDALGHVNRRLVVVAVEGDEVRPPVDIVGPGDTPAGVITSACRSTRLGCVIGLALVHVKVIDAGGPLSVAGRPARILTAADAARASAGGLADLPGVGLVRGVPE